MDFDDLVDHLALARVNSGHVDRDRSSIDPKFLMAAKQRGNFGCMKTFLLGRHATFGQDPPMYFLSTTAVRFPSLAIVHASTLPPVPLPNTRTSYLSRSLITMISRIIEHYSESRELSSTFVASRSFWSPT